MMLQRELEGIEAQRDFLLKNTWVAHKPMADGEGCLVMRIDAQYECVQVVIQSGTCSATLAIQQAITELDPENPDPEGLLWDWNDHRAKGAGQVIEVLERAAGIIKEQISEASEGM